MESAFEKWASRNGFDMRKDQISTGAMLFSSPTTINAKQAWDAALEERDKAWQSWRKQLLDAWAKDHRATMTALLEGGPELKEQK